MALRNFTLLTLACHSEEESKYLRIKFIIYSLYSDTNETSSSTFILPCIFFVFLFLPGSVDATWRISSSSLRMCARQDCFVFERPQVVFYSNFSSSRHVSKSANLIGRIVFDAARQTKKTNPRRFFFKWRFYAWCFSRRCAHSHWRPLFSHEALNVGEYRARNSSRCVRALRDK